jgi:hypothetical protein
MPGVNFESDDPDFDAQDVAETVDETNFDLRPNSNERRTFEELPDVLDVTQAEGDRDDDEALALDADEFDEEAFGDDALEEDDELDYHAARESDPQALGGDEERVATDDDEISDYQASRLSDAEIARLG